MLYQLLCISEHRHFSDLQKKHSKHSSSATVLVQGNIRALSLRDSLGEYI